MSSSKPERIQLDETKRSGDGITYLPGGTSRKRKEYWNTYKTYRDNENKIRAECIYCHKTFAADPCLSGTQNLSRHWKACLKNPANKSDGKQLKLVVGNMEESPDYKMRNCVPDESKFIEALIQMIIVQGFPFNCVQKPGMRNLLRAICPPTFHLPSPETVARECFVHFLKEKVKLKKFLKSSCQRVCLSTEPWTTIETLNYMSLTAHFIDSDWLLQKEVLNLFPLGDLTGSTIGRGIENCLEHWGLCDKVFSITVGNANANDVVCDHLRQMVIENGACINHGKNLQVKCVAQTISLIVWDVLKEYSADIEKVRSVIQFIRYSRYRLNILEDELDEEDELENEGKSRFFLDMPTTWNSTYEMLNSALINKDAFSQLDIPKDEVDSFVEHITSEEWSRIEMLVKFLKEFYDFTKYISSFSNVTINTTIFQMGHILKLLNRWVESSDPICQTMALQMKKKWDTHWGDSEKMNMLVFVAVMLDPTYRYIGLQFGLCRLYGTEVGDLLATRAKEFADGLFDEYRNIYASSSQSQPPSESRTHSASVNDGFWPSLVNDVNEKCTMQPNESNSGGLAKTELDCYLNEQNSKGVTDILTWWKLNRLRFPILAHMARDVLAIPVSSVPSESVFSSEGRTFDEYRSSLTSMALQGLVCAGDWLGGKPPKGPKSESDVEFPLEEMEQIEIDFQLKF